MKVIEAPNKPSNLAYNNMTKLFLAGGITDCPDWQSEVIEELSKYNDLGDLMIFNPRRKDFDITDKDASRKQIEWEFEYLNDMDIFTMYFAKSETSVQPICMYELGRHLARMCERYRSTWPDRILIGIEDGYLRSNDVEIQSELALGNTICYNHITPVMYAQLIHHLYLKLHSEQVLKQIKRG